MHPTLYKVWGALRPAARSHRNRQPAFGTTARNARLPPVDPWQVVTEWEWSVRGGIPASQPPARSVLRAALHLLHAVRRTPEPKETNHIEKLGSAYLAQKAGTPSTTGLNTQGIVARQGGGA